MQNKKILAVALVAALVSGCQLSETERTLAGAATGAVAANVTGGNVAVGAAVGAAAGALCDNAGVCK